MTLRPDGNRIQLQTDLNVSSFQSLRTWIRIVLKKVNGLNSTVLPLLAAKFALSQSQAEALTGNTSYLYEQVTQIHSNIVVKCMKL